MIPDGLPLTFNLFPNLPVELQRKIWHQTLPGPRIIQVHRHDGRYGRDGAFCFNGARPPAALHTCRTSREVACSVFEIVFTHDNISTNKPLPPIYIDFAHDTIHLALISRSWQLRTCVPSELLGASGHLLMTQSQLESLSLITDSSCQLNNGIKQTNRTIPKLANFTQSGDMATVKTNFMSGI